MVVRRVSILFALGAAGVVLYLAVGWGTSRLSREEVHARANEVVRAVDRYREANGVLPKSIDELVGRYLKEDPRRRRDGLKWEYYTWGPGSPHPYYTLLAEHPDETLEFDSRLGRWFWKDSSF